MRLLRQIDSQCLEAYSGLGMRIIFWYVEAIGFISPSKGACDVPISMMRSSGLIVFKALGNSFFNLLGSDYKRLIHDSTINLYGTGTEYIMITLMSFPRSKG